MSALAERQRRETIELLRQKPFECDQVYFFGFEDGRLTPLDEPSVELYSRYKEILDNLPQEPVKGWPGNILAGPREDNLVRFYASYRFGSIMLVLSKTVAVAQGQRVHSPFDKYFLDAVSASVGALVADSAVHRVTDLDITQPEPVEFTELTAWKECKELWRARYGSEKWLAIKAGRPVAQASSLEELREAVLQLRLQPPVLFAPPEGQEPTSGVPLAISPQPGNATSSEKELQ